MSIKLKAKVDRLETDLEKLKGLVSLIAERLDEQPKPPPKQKKGAK